MDYNLQIQKIIVKAENVDSPEDKIKLFKEAIQLADAHNDIEWGFDLRLDLMEEEFYTSHDNESFAAFAWLLDVCDRQPDLFDEDDLLWKYKWMISSARCNSSISLEQIDTISEDFKMRLERNGYSLRPYYGQKYNLELFHLNNLQKASEYLQLRDKATRDDIADCYACELDDNVTMELKLGNTEKALTLGKDLFSGKLTCAHVPFITYCTLIEHFHETGDTEKEHEFFVKAEDCLAELVEENDTSQIGNVGNMILFLTTFDNKKAWEYFETYIHWSLNCDEMSTFDIASTVLPLLSGNETRTLNVNPQMAWYRADNTYSIPELYNYYAERAENLAKRFDARNGNSLFSDTLNKLKK